MCKMVEQPLGGGGGGCMHCSLYIRWQYCSHIYNSVYVQNWSPRCNTGGVIGCGLLLVRMVLYCNEKCLN